MIRPVAVVAMVLALHAVCIDGTTLSGDNSTPIETGAIRFAGASTDAGRIEIFHNGQWGSVCGMEKWTIKEETVACRQLGFGTATGSMYLPGDSGGSIALSSISCTGEEAELGECRHLGWGKVADGCSHAKDVGVRCLACGEDEEHCRVDSTTVRLEEPYGDAETVVTEFYNQDSDHNGIHLQCVNSTNTKSISCKTSFYAAFTAADTMATASGQDEHKHGQFEHTHDSDSDSDSNFDFGILPDPFNPDARRSFIFGDALAAEYRAKREEMQRFFRRNPEAVALLQGLVQDGSLQWNNAGIDARRLHTRLPIDSSAMGIIRKLYFSPKVNMLADLDISSRVDTKWLQTDYRRVQLSPADNDNETALKLAAALHQDGFVEIDDYGLDIDALLIPIRDAFRNADPKLTNVAANGASAATRIKLDGLDPLIHNQTISHLVRSYLGPDAELSGYKVVHLSPNRTENENIAGMWHNDRVGHRLKMFVRLHDVDPDPQAGGHPTLFARGSHNMRFYSMEAYANSRYTEDFVRSQWPVVSLGGAKGGGYIFDTNVVHKAVPEGLLDRTVIVLEYHSAMKCPVIRRLKIPLPCPSGDQRLISHKLIGQTVQQPLSSSLPKSGECILWTPVESYNVQAGSGDGNAVSLPTHATAVGAESYLVYDTETQAFTSSANAQNTKNQFIASLHKDCVARWRRYTYDIMPFDGRMQWFHPTFDISQFGVCVYEGEFGRVEFSGENAGGCIVQSTGVTTFGNFDGLLTWKSDADEDSKVEDRDNSHASDALSTGEAQAKFLAAVETYITTEDIALMESTTGRPLKTLLDGIKALDSRTMEAITSTTRFVPHPLNEHGLHILRYILAERMSDHRHSNLFTNGEVSDELRQAWREDGYLRLRFDHYVGTNGVGNDLLEDVLRMCSGLRWPSLEPYQFVERDVVHLAKDEQYALHQDTFHQAIKIWVYDSNTTIENGTLHYVPGSHRVSRSTLAWLYNRTYDNSPQIVEEPSIRLTADNVEVTEAAPYLQQFGFRPAVPVLPREKVGRTLVIADASGLHCRGRAPAGTRRLSLRPMGASHNGGVRRTTPFEF